MPDPSRHPVFPMFVGVPRSGTTLVLSLFDQHPEMAVPVLPGFIVPFARAIGTGRIDLREPTWFVTSLERSSHGRELLARLGPAIDELREDPPTDLPGGVRRVYTVLAGQQGKARYGDKTPAHVVDLPLLVELFPEARFVHVIRDGRDVATSMLNSPSMPDRIVQAAVHWADWLGKGRTDGAALGPERYTELRYEALVRDPEAELRRVCAFLELPFDPGMLRYPEAAPERLAHVREPGLHHRVRQPIAAGARDWRSELAPRQVAAFELVAADRLTECRYDLSGLRPAPFAAALIRAEATTARLRNRLRARERIAAAASSVREVAAR